MAGEARISFHRRANFRRLGVRTLRRRLREASPSEVVTEIADTGPGLPNAELEQVFKPFYRGSEARTSSKGGVGLGLAVSRSTIRTHGGELKLARASSGLVAEVRLPLAPPSAVAA